jgi:histidinol-phosphate aminotransferase
MQLLDTILNTRIRSDVISMHAYPVQDATGMLKLDAMENPYRLSAALQAELGARLGALALNRYPGSRIQDLRQALARHAGMPPGYDIMLGNGSDELISLLSLACARPAPPDSKRSVVLAPIPGFVMYAMSAQLQGLDFVGVPLTPDFELDTPAMLEAIRSYEPAIIYLAYPNNPTATLWKHADMALLIAAAAQTGSIVVVDEAYQPFSSHSYIDCMRAEPEQHSHVLLMRTLSKFGLAGVRMGYLIGRTELIAQLDKVRPPYNVSVLNSECALFALEHASVFEAQAQHICDERARLSAALAAIPCIKVWNSQANMLLMRIHGPLRGQDTDADPAQFLFEKLKENGILVKNVSKMHSLLAQCLRITVGSPEENTQLLTAIQKFV